jgi:hypothetical protein
MPPPLQPAKSRHDSAPRSEEEDRECITVRIEPR